MSSEMLDRKADAKTAEIPTEAGGRGRWAPYLAEGIGTFGLVFAGCGAIMIDRLSGGQVTHVGVGLVFGLIITVMIYALPGKTVRGHELFPWIFNVADSLLCVGVALMILYSLFSAPRRPAEEEPPGAGASSCSDSTNGSAVTISCTTHPSIPASWPSCAPRSSPVRPQSMSARMSVCIR